MIQFQLNGKQNKLQNIMIFQYYDMKYNMLILEKLMIMIIMIMMMIMILMMMMMIMMMIKNKKIQLKQI